jgi:glutathione S-transferase
MIQLHQFRPFWGVPNASPFCMKAETYLRYRNIPFDIVISSPRKSPSGQVPFVMEEDSLTAITDTQKIIEYFEARQKHHIDEGLSDKQLAQAFLARQLIEHQLFWQINYMRWGDASKWAEFGPALKKNLPPLMRGPAIFFIRQRLIKQMRFMGLQPANPDAAYAKGNAILDALSLYLGDKLFFLDDKPRSIDMSAYAFLANILDQHQSNPLQKHGQGLENLVAYCKRMKALTFKDQSHAPVSDLTTRQ